MAEGERAGRVEQARFSRREELDGLEMLSATYVTHSFAPHTHEGFVISAITRGAEAFWYRGETHVASAGQVVFINPDEVHTGHAPHPDGWTYRTFYPSVALLERAAQSLFGPKAKLPFFSEAVVFDPALNAKVADTLATLEQSDSVLERETRWLELLVEVVARYADGSGAFGPVGSEHRSEHGAVALAKAHLELHAPDGVTLSDLSNLTGLSGFHLTRVFRRHLGLPPHAYQAQLRVRLAKALLREGRGIAEVATDVGFSDQSHLTRQFKRLVGVTPAKYALAARAS